MVLNNDTIISTNEKDYQNQNTFRFDITTGKETDVSRQKEKIIERLKSNGCRITKQRLHILDVILENHCTSCKEIFYRASALDSGIGIATVYRMVNALEEVGVLSRRIVYESAEFFE